MNFWSILAIVAPIVISIGTLIIVFMKFPHEVRVLDETAASQDAGASASYATATKTYAEEIIRLRKELADERERSQKSETALRAEMAEMRRVYEDKFSTLTCELDHVKADYTEVRDWAERLSHQVIALGGIPVPMRAKEVGKA